LQKIYTNLRQFVQADYQPKVYAAAAIFAVLALYINYFSPLKGTNFTVEERFSYALRSEHLLYFAYLPFYGLPYLLILYIKLQQSQSLAIFSNTLFWRKFALAILVLCISGGFYFPVYKISYMPFHVQMVITQYIYALQGFFTVFACIALYYFCFETEKIPTLYGMQKGGFTPKPYLILLGLMALPVFVASFSADFQNQYPNLGGPFIQDTWGIPKNFIVVFYEFLYLLDFLNLELLMRGFMVVGFVHVLGRHAVLPTTIVYLLLHFEKPLAEAIGSIFGGYILAVISLQTRSIWGGCLVHIGIAALMELFAFLQKI
jgi:hypothetical protein